MLLFRPLPLTPLQSPPKRVLPDAALLDDLKASDPPSDNTHESLRVSGKPRGKKSRSTRGLRFRFLSPARAVYYMHAPRAPPHDMLYRHSGRTARRESTTLRAQSSIGTKCCKYLQHPACRPSSLSELHGCMGTKQRFVVLARCCWPRATLCNWAHTSSPRLSFTSL